MRKLYLLMTLLFPLATMFSSGGAKAADPDKALYDAAIAAFPSGAYYITTEIDGVKYYVAATGALEEWGEEHETTDGLFTINQVSGGALYDIGWHIEGANGHFSNTTLVDSKALLKPGTGVFRLDTSNNRNDWESQVFYMNEEGKIAIRSCNTAFGESSWADAGRAFWTYEVDEAGEIVWSDYGPMPAYSYEPAYIWTLEQPVGFELVKLALNNIIGKYDAVLWDEREEPVTLNMGTEFGQYSDFETWYKLYDFIQELNTLIDEKINDPDYDYYTDPEAVTLEEAEQLAATADSLYLSILDSEVPYALPNGDGYYRIIAHNLYKSEFDESGFVNKAFAASFEESHKDKGVWGTLRRDRANFLWKLTQHGDSILIQNAGLGTYISFSSGDRVVMTEDETDATHLVFDYAGFDYTELDGEGEDRDIFCIRLAREENEKRWPADGEGNVSTYHQARYFHQAGHSSKADDSSPWGNYGTDTGADQEITFWRRTYDYAQGVDTWTSEWFLEYVPDEEAEQVIADFEAIFNHDKLVEQNNELRAKVLEDLTKAKDVQRTALIKNVSQLSSPYSDSSEGQHLEYLIDGDASTFWHTTWHGLAEGVDPFYYYGEGYEESGLECHYLQISGMGNMVGDCELYLREREGADNDRVKTLVVMGTDNLKNEDEDWDEILRVTLPHTDKAEENSVFFHLDEAYPYIRVFAIETAYSSYAFRTFWHASEIQFYTIEENPNSQFVLMGQIAQDLQDAYDANCAIADEDLELKDYEALKAAYEAFLDYGLIDPSELRQALATYENATDCVTEGAGPGYWSDMTVVNDYNTLYNEVVAYNKAGRYKADEIHKYAVMLKAMQKSFMETANGVATDKWYRIMYPTEEMFDAYDWNKEGGDKCGDLAPEDQQTMWGTFVSAAKLESEEETTTNDDGEEVTVTNNWLEDIAAEDLREGDRLFFMNDDAIEDKATSMFRFVELESDGADYTPLLADVKENMLMALDMSATYKQGDALITDAAQFSSNASYPGNDGQKLETGCLIDGDFGTYWHSDYGRTFCCVPYLQIALNEPVSGLIEVYVGRRNTSNGHVTRMYVQGSNDAETWTNIGYIELPYTNASTPATSQPLDLGGTFSHLRFSMTQRYGSDGGSNIEFDPFAEGITADDYNVKYTYFHASEFQIYPVTPTKQLSPSAQALQDAYTAANKVVLKDASAEDLAAASQAYKTFQTEFNSKEGKTVLPNGLDKAPATYALQNKATGLFVMVSGTGNQNNIYLKAVPTLVGYKAIGYQRSLLSAKNTDGVSCNNLHAGESNRRFCTWGTTDPTTNSGLVIAEADAAFEVPAEYTFTKDIKPGRIYGLCNSVTLTPVDAPEGAVAYTPLGRYQNDEGDFLALKAIENIPAGQPVIYIYGDTTSYDADDEYVEPVKFKYSTDEKLVLKGDTINGFIASLVNHSLKAHEIYFSGNHAQCIGTTGYYISGPCVVLDMPECPNVDPEGDYDFSICLNEEGDTADGVKTVLKNISKPGNVYSMDGKLLMTGATLNSLKTLGKGMYILNGVKVLVK
ncbi:MAG: discoidin domain-containing protein [Bacteroidaceae bacterium]|nr:discoidin domain-containing protein [Bacteroidaceae bacterium]